MPGVPASRAGTTPPSSWDLARPARRARPLQGGAHRRRAPGRRPSARRQPSEHAHRPGGHPDHHGTAHLIPRQVHAFRVAPAEPADPLSTSVGKRVNLIMSSTTTCRGSEFGIVGQEPVWTAVRGAGVKAVSPATAGRRRPVRSSQADLPRPLRGPSEPGFRPSENYRAIPARAGPLRRRRSPIAAPSVHPRACGVTPRETGCGRGHSVQPRACGARLDDLRPHRARKRFSPARAGHMFLIALPRYLLAVHSRARRGGLGGKQILFEFLGLIPARAGQPESGSSTRPEAMATPGLVRRCCIGAPPLSEPASGPRVSAYPPGVGGLPRISSIRPAAHATAVSAIVTALRYSSSVTPTVSCSWSNSYRWAPE